MYKADEKLEENNFAPQSWGGINPVLPILSVLFQIKFIELFGVSGRTHIPFPGGSHQDPGHPGEGAPRRQLVPIEGSAGQEDDDGYGEAQSGKGVAQSPAHVVLDVDEDGVGKEGAEEDAEKPPVEEGELVKLLSGVEVVKLVSANGGDVGLGSSCSYGESVECSVEHG